MKVFTSSFRASWKVGILKFDMLTADSCRVLFSDSAIEIDDLGEWFTVCLLWSCVEGWVRFSPCVSDSDVSLCLNWVSLGCGILIPASRLLIKDDDTSPFIQCTPSAVEVFGCREGFTECSQIAQRRSVSLCCLPLIVSRSEWNLSESDDDSRDSCEFGSFLIDPWVDFPTLTWPLGLGILDIYCGIAGLQGDDGTVIKVWFQVLLILDLLWSANLIWQVPPPLQLFFVDVLKQGERLSLMWGCACTSRMYVELDTATCRSCCADSDRSAEMRCCLSACSVSVGSVRCQKWCRSDCRNDGLPAVLTWPIVVLGHLV